MTPAEDDERFQRLALAEARAALALDEVPIGAVVVHRGAVLGWGHNLRETVEDPTAHAEIVAMRQAARALGTWRLDAATLYVTLEPCPMCAGAILQARVPRVVFGAYDPKAGACGSLYELHQDTRLNHRFVIVPGVLADECAQLLREFFAAQRAKGKK